jgi:putative addiction module killer protein
MNAEPHEVEVYESSPGVAPFVDWLDGLRDCKAQAAVDARLLRLRLGNFGDCEPVGEGVYELRIHYGPGYRVYFAKTQQTVVLLLMGGAKKSQTKDIKMAKIYWREYSVRVRNERKFPKL